MNKTQKKFNTMHDACKTKKQANIFCATFRLYQTIVPSKNCLFSLQNNHRASICLYRTTAQLATSKINQQAYIEVRT